MQIVRPRPTVLSTDEARQGVTGHNVRHVLAWGLLGVVTAYLVVGLLATQGVFGPVAP
jgi:hypothetical protein